ncbi:acyl-CoA carboxylase subunit beta [Shimazuella alba]|uniref:Acyl-CoA carboxylase subunit beta n=1 Tax=Shimazuella alba TaxID=2690964 RepID=A0A6I4VZK6_9BACL|nr:acyl-CoA carboxylase subunit beta [Shimazuella alba]MXQ55365.1 acyl-CoA carboxylase subunit beta [Shimazuella alba]
MSELRDKSKRLQSGGSRKYHEKLAHAGKLFARERLRLLLDQDSFVEDGLFANSVEDGLAADGVITGTGKINGTTVCVMANDSTVKAGSWGKRTVEKIIRIQETAEKLRSPLLYLVDSAGARITDQLEMFPGRRGAGKIFYNQVKLSGVVPQICLLFGPSAAGGAYIPAFCDVVIMVDKNASMYLGSPRMAEMVIGQKVSLEEMGGARMHCSVSGCGDFLAKDESEAIQIAKSYFAYWQQPIHKEFRSNPSVEKISSIVPKEQNLPFDMKKLINLLVDQNSSLEVKELFAPELITMFARLNGRAIGIIANQSKVKGGVLFGDSADKAARFITLCDAYQIPLLFLIDVPGFMVGTQVERAGIIRHGAKMIAAMSEATVPKISVIVRKAYGAGLYAMAGPAFEPDCCIALPTAQIAVMGPEAAVNAVYHNQIQAMEPEARETFIQEKRKAYQEDIHIYRLASELIVDAMVELEDLRYELAKRYDLYGDKQIHFSKRKHPIYPV